MFSAPLTLEGVFSTLQKLATLEGTGSQDVKLAELSRLLTSAKPVEAKFIVRTVVEDLRVGIAGGSLRDGLAFAFFAEGVLYDRSLNSIVHTMKEGYVIEEVKEDLKRALDLTADFSAVFKHVLAGKSLKDIQLRIGTPCKVMLARKERTFSDAFARTGFPVRLEYKYDGFRLQIHKNGSKVQLFTRRLEDVSAQFPDVIDAVRKHVGVMRCILDAEAVGYDPLNGRYQPFQHVSKRIKRKYQVNELIKELPVELNVFDILMMGDEILLDKPLPERLKALNRAIREPKNRFVVIAKGIQIDTETQAETFYQESLDAGNEGVMIKNKEKTIEMGRMARQYYEQNYTAEINYSILMRIYDKAVKTANSE